MALSLVSIENARMNMHEEVSGKDFEVIVQEASACWENELEKIRIEGTDLQKTLFYTALYHTMVQPNVMSDVNGDYMAADYTVRHVGQSEKLYSTFSLWDTFRAAHLLYMLIEAEKVGDFVKSMFCQYDYYGYPPI